MSQNNFSAVRGKLLRWYGKNKRDLPWRRTRDPYAIWVAETMLHQTQVATVIPYYERFLAAFPTVAALDRAPLRKVLTLWSGLGYYRRAENLKKSARVLSLNHGGRLPNDYQALRALPGVGDYTAGAVSSIAFGKAHPAIDGNARRVLGRIFALDTVGEIHDLATQLVPANAPGYFNQALMDLGATLCIPKNPRCTLCPVLSHCKTPTSNREVTLKKAYSFSRNVVWPLAIVRRNGAILVRRRPPNGLLAGLWELPGDEKKPRDSITATIRQQFKTLDWEIARPRRIGEIRHTITNRRIRAPIFLFAEKAERKLYLPIRGWRWLPEKSFRRQPLSSMTLKALAVLAAYEKSSD